METGIVAVDFFYVFGAGEDCEGSLRGGEEVVRGEDYWEGGCCCGKASGARVLGFTLVLGSRWWWIREFVEDVGVVVMVVFCWGEESCFRHC